MAAAPALPHINLLAAPPWAIFALTGAFIHVVYLVWVVSLPDWSTVWLGGCLFALTALGYLTGGALAAMQIHWFGLSEQRGTAVSWAIVLAVLFGVVAFGCFRYGNTWRREFDAQHVS